MSPAKSPVEIDGDGTEGALSQCRSLYLASRVEKLKFSCVMSADVRRASDATVANLWRSSVPLVRAKGWRTDALVRVGLYDRVERPNHGCNHEVWPNAVTFAECDAHAN